jgi:hypothetical protein
MMIRLAQRLSLLFCFCSFVSSAADQIKGVVIETATGKPMAGVYVENVDAHTLITTDSTGGFAVTVARGQLIEFKKTGFKTQRWKVPAQGIIPPYFKVYLQVEVLQPAYVFEGPPKSWKEDSQRYASFYERELKFPKMSTLDMINHPFSAMSKQSQQIWAFQKEYAWFQQEKYIDYTFNKTIVANLTGLSGDSAAAYVRMYRPSYEQLRDMKEYEFYSFITRTVQMYRRGINPRRPNIRTSN